MAKELYYWANFLEIQSKISVDVIVVGSHSDKLSSDPLKIKKKYEYVEEIATDALQKCWFAGFVALDCRQLSKHCFQPLLVMLQKSSQILATKVKNERMSFSCHMLHRFLLEVVNKTAITLGDLKELIANESHPPLPTNPDMLQSSLETLANKGLVLCLWNKLHLLSSCIVIDQRGLMEEINGMLFAPTAFEEHHKIASNTGIVPVSLLCKCFPHYEMDMLVMMLTAFEFCHELDHILLKAIATNLSAGSTSGERLLFFPALVSASRLGTLIIAKGFGWVVFCKNPHQILTTRFLQVTLLRLAFKFCLVKRNIPKLELPHTRKLRPLARECTVWKNGIHWTTEDCIEAVVEVSEQHRRVSVIVSWDENNVTEHIKLHSSLIGEILAIHQEFCPTVDLEEYLIPPCEVMKLLDQDLAEISVFSLHDVTRCILLRKPCVHSVDRKERRNPSSLLLHDPYQLLHSTTVQLLFDRDKSDKPVSKNVMRELHSRCGAMLSMCSSALSTHQSLQNQLDKFSVFAGRNPLVSTCVKIMMYMYIGNYD